MARLNQWADRTHAIIQARRADPYRSTIDIATEFGVSRERVRQILARAGLRTVALQTMVTLVCPTCDVIFPREGRRSKYCSPECGRVAPRGKPRVPRIQLVCETCLGPTERKQSEIDAKQRHNERINAKSRHVFCSPSCHGVWLGKNHGRGRKKQDAENRATATS